MSHAIFLATSGRFATGILPLNYNIIRYRKPALIGTSVQLITQMIFAVHIFIRFDYNFYHSANNNAMHTQIAIH